MLNKLNKKKNISLEIILDDGFNGTMYGLPEESLGCNLRGKVVLNNTKSFSAKSLIFSFHGKITVACGPPMSSTRPEYSEIKTVFRRECTFHNSELSNRRISAGTHEHYFDIDLPGHLPSSFKGTRGKVEYYCNAVLERPVFCNDIIIKKPINIKRCLVDDTRAPQIHHATFSEGILDEKIRYQISTPIMTFREGGLIHTELKLKSMDPDTVIETIEYGLKEQINYHTTGEEAMTITANVDEDRFPLGKKRIKIDYLDDEDQIPINVRLCPWVNCDMDSQLINIRHKLSFTVCISEASEDLLGEEANPNSRRSSRRFSSRVGRNNSAFFPKRGSRTFSIQSLQSIVSPQRTMISRVERKRLNFEIPVIVTSKSCKPRQQSSHYATTDRPPAYAIASMVPPPPEYVGRERLSHEAHEQEYVAYDL